jgi:hypothetical protein
MPAKKHEESGEKVPLWYVSFADMITLLLSFFVMLQTMAKSQDATLFDASQESFRRSIQGMGMPDILLGKKPVMEMDYNKLRYPTEEAVPKEAEPVRMIDADDQMIRQLFEEVGHQMEVRTDDARETTVAQVVTPIRFAKGAAALSPADTDYLKGLSGTLTQSLRGSTSKLCVIAVAPDEPDVKGQFLVSARRALAVEGVLKEILAPGAAAAPGGSISAWGAGAGGALCRKLGLDGKGVQVVIVISESGIEHGGK